MRNLNFHPLHIRHNSFTHFNTQIKLEYSFSKHSLIPCCCAMQCWVHSSDHGSHDPSLPGLAASAGVTDLSLIGTPQVKGDAGTQRSFVTVCWANRRMEEGQNSQNFHTKQLPSFGSFLTQPSVFSSVVPSRKPSQMPPESSSASSRSPLSEHRSAFPTGL